MIPSQSVVHLHYAERNSETNAKQSKPIQTTALGKIPQIIDLTGIATQSESLLNSFSYPLRSSICRASKKPKS